MRTFLRLAAIALALSVLASIVTVMAAANSVPESGAEDAVAAFDPDELIPEDCLSFQLDEVIYGSGIILGTNRSDLIFGGAGGDTISGLNQKDCILAGGGNDIVFGGNSEDALFGGDGNDIITGGNGQDICYGGAGTDTFFSCETTFP